MNRLGLIALVIALPGGAFAAEQCAIPGPASIPTATIAPAPSSRSTSKALGGLPFVARVKSGGAHVLDFGMVHGVRLIGARSGQEFRVFSMLPDGSAAVEGAPVALTVAQLTSLAASKITPLGRASGFDGIFVRSGAQFQVFYATPDGQAVIPGILRDATGTNVTRAQVQAVPGAIPTIDLRAENAGPSAPAAPAAKISAEVALGMVQKANFGSVGPASAPEVFMVIDPQCIYSIRAFQQLHVYAAAGKIRLTLVPVSVLDYEDKGRSTRSALALLTKTPEEITTAWQRGDTNDPATPEARQKLAANMAVAEAIGLKGTPTLLWRGRDGKAGRIDGAPTNILALIASAGG